MDSNKDQKPQQQPDNNGRERSLFEDVKQKLQPHNANPGPAIPQNFTAQQEGTKEERRAKAEQLNK